MTSLIVEMIVYLFILIQLYLSHKEVANAAAFLTLTQVAVVIGVSRGVTGKAQTAVS